ncbi:hypothetical protein V1521DRAFT_424786 [Lipomyces starkeyi]
MAFSLFGGSDKKDSGAAPTSGDSSNVNSIKENLQAQILQEIALTNATELISKISNNCYEKCILNPGSSLSAADAVCLNMLRSVFGEVHPGLEHYLTEISCSRTIGIEELNIYTFGATGLARVQV